MKTYPTPRGSRFGTLSDILLLVLLAVSLFQIGVCFDAGRLLVAPAALPVVHMAPLLGTNAPAAGTVPNLPAVKSPGFSTHAARS